MRRDGIFWAWFQSLESRDIGALNLRRHRTMVLDSVVFLRKGLFWSILVLMLLFWLMIWLSILLMSSIIRLYGFLTTRIAFVWRVDSLRLRKRNTTFRLR